MSQYAAYWDILVNGEAKRPCLGVLHRGTLEFADLDGGWMCDHLPNKYKKTAVYTNVNGNL